MTNTPAGQDHPTPHEKGDSAAVDASQVQPAGDALGNIVGVTNYSMAAAGSRIGPSGFTVTDGPGRGAEMRAEKSDKLPYDIHVAHLLFRQGVHLQTFIDAAKRWHTRAATADISTIDYAALSRVLAKAHAALRLVIDSDTEGTLNAPALDAAGFAAEAIEEFARERGIKLGEPR